MVMNDAPASEISDYIKSLMYAKAGEKSDAMKPEVADAYFGTKDNEEQEEE
jgi:hypothetical protein